MDAAAALHVLRFWAGYESELTTLGLFAVGIAVYGLAVFAFYHTLSRRNLFYAGKAATRRQARWRRIAYAGLFPVVSFGFFLLLSSALFVLSKNQTVEGILLTSMSLVAGIRVAAYLNEQVSHELAKLVPLGFLGVVLIDPGFLDAQTTIDRFLALPALGGLLARYLVAVVLLEYALRLVYLLVPKRVRADEIVRLAPRTPVAGGAALPRSRFDLPPRMNAGAFGSRPGKP